MSIALTAISASGARRAAKFDPAARLGRGGAGTVFRDETEAHYVLKIYNDALDGQNRIKPGGSASARGNLARVEAMLQHPPQNQIAKLPQDPSVPWSKRLPSVVQIAWPLETLVDSASAFVGFSMRVADLKQTEPIESFFDIASRREVATRYQLGDHTAFDYTYRLGILRNLAGLLDSIHQAGHAIGDLNPQNVQIYVHRGLACLIDCDGFRIEAGGTIFPCLKMLDEIAAPEILQVASGFDPQRADRYQDLFAFGLIVFRMLNDNRSPFHVVGRQPSVQVPGAISERIKAGLYGYGSGPSAVAVGPAPGSLHGAWPAELRRYFDLCFQPGGDPRLRPTAADWQHLLDGFRSQARDCSKHGRGALLDGRTCVYCARDGTATAVASPQVVVPPGRSISGGPARVGKQRGAVSRNGRWKVWLAVVVGLAVVALPIVDWKPTALPPPGGSGRPSAAAAPEPTPRPPPFQQPRSAAKAERPAVPQAPAWPVQPVRPAGAGSGAPAPTSVTPQQVVTAGNASTTVPAPNRDLGVVVGELQRKLRDMRLLRGDATGSFDEATRAALVAVGIQASAAPGAREMEQISVKLSEAGGRLAANQRNAAALLISWRFGAEAFAVLTRDDLLVASFAVNFALDKFTDGETFRHSGSTQALLEYVEVKLRETDPGAGCRKFDMTINRPPSLWTVKGIRACRFGSHWALED